jgi:hypothetical protein
MSNTLTNELHAYLIGVQAQSFIRAGKTWKETEELIAQADVRDMRTSLVRELTAITEKWYGRNDSDG